MKKNEQTNLSKAMSYVLRHCPESLGLHLGDAGWVAVDILIVAFQSSGKQYTKAMIEHVVRECDKQRFELSQDGGMIRARQGHSVKVALSYDAATPPTVLYHGTAERFLESIMAQGLLKCKRHHVHLSTNAETMRTVGMRHGKPVLLKIDAAKLHDAGHKFYLTGNDVWLTDHVPVAFISRVKGD